MKITENTVPFLEMCLLCFQCSLDFQTSFSRIPNQKPLAAKTIISKVLSTQKFRVHCVCDVSLNDVTTMVACAREMAAKKSQYKKVMGVWGRPLVSSRLVASLSKRGQVSL